MQSIEELNRSFAIPNVARFESAGALSKLVITAPAASGEIYTHGAHVTQFTPRGQKPVMYVSGKSLFQNDKPIRGGVPLVFPWFGPRQDGLGAMHGFARVRNWTVREVKQAGEGVRVVMRLESDDQTREIWPHDFQADFTATFGSSLDMQLAIRNAGSSPIRYEEAFHTYFAVGDVRECSIDGLEGVEYIDKVLGGDNRKQAERSLKLSAATDRVYLGTAGGYAIHDPILKRKITINKSNSRAAVVWNPFPEKVTGLADVDPNDWPKFLCVETCNVRRETIELAAGATHVFGTTISL